MSCNYTLEDHTGCETIGVVALREGVGVNAPASFFPHTV